jgi:LacI family transcriptional regulator
VFYRRTANVSSASRKRFVKSTSVILRDSVRFYESVVLGVIVNALPGRRPTMKDVASLAGVSLSTVSRVVSGNADVRPDLIRRVEDAVAVLGYRRDLTASTLRRTDRLSSTIGLIIEDVANPFFSAVHRGVEDVARAHGVLTFAGSSDEDPERERELAEAFAARGVDGLVIVPCSSDQGYLRRDRDAGTALVFVDRPPRFIDADAVVTDNVGGAQAAVTHLLEAGHRRIGFLGDRPQVFTAAERLRGYRAALAAAGVEEDPALERLGLVDSAAGERAAGELLVASEPPTALFTAQNLITVGAMRALRAAGLEHEVALVSFDDVMLADMVEPSVTVVAQEPYELGRHAAELLFSRLSGFDGETRRVVVPVRLVTRGSGEIAPAQARV